MLIMAKLLWLILCLGKLRQGAKLVLELGPCKDCERYQYKSFELNIVVSQACLAGASLLCVSHNLRKHGIRKFLFVDQLSGRTQYIQQISMILSIFAETFYVFPYYKTLLDCFHRFRIFLLLQFLVVTVSQFTTLFQTTAYSGRITYINGGDFARGESSFSFFFGFLLYGDVKNLMVMFSGLCGGPSCWDYFMSARSNEDIS
ncbi:unnamed protein product [Brassica oleracea]|uniref:Uncharacterized protein n=1 Tax=Brassica oleracea TaxID=3712 RepID=A0A3P6AZM2_BRAOL|nr:unnamed protein product [Brassica oleracea]